MVTRPGDTTPVPSANHAPDVGCACGSLAMQVHHMGWATRVMAGFDGARDATPRCSALEFVSIDSFRHWAYPSTRQMNIIKNIIYVVCVLRF
jgi:hypothetical protein